MSMPEDQVGHWRGTPEDAEALSAASQSFHKPRNGFVDRNRGKLGFVAGFSFAAGIAIAHHEASSRRPEQIQPQVQAKVVGVLLCNPEEGCVALRPEELEEFGEGCEPNLEEPPPYDEFFPQNFLDESQGATSPLNQNQDGVEL